MDTDSGKLRPIHRDADGTDRFDDDDETVPGWMQRYRRDELVSVKGVMFRVDAIRADALLLRPIKTKERKCRRSKPRRR